MQKGNYGNAVQAVEESGLEQDLKNGRGYSKNIDLVRIAQGEDEELSMRATEELVILNRGLVRSVAIRFRERGLELEDLIQIGTIGLIKAIRSFDIGRGTLFSTYAVPMIFGEIRRALRDEGMIKVGRYYKTLVTFCTDNI